MHAVPQVVPRSVEQNPQMLGGNLEPPRDLFTQLLVEHPVGYDESLALREGVEALVESFARLGMVRRFLRVGTGGGHVRLGLVEGSGLLAPRGAAELRSLLPQDAPQERADLRVTAKLPHHVEERLPRRVHDIVHVARAEAEPLCGPTEIVSVLFNDPFERLSFAASESLKPGRRRLRAVDGFGHAWVLPP